MERPLSDIASMVNAIFTFVRREAQRMEIGEVDGICFLWLWRLGGRS